MKKILAVLIDDEADSIDTLRWKLDNYCPDVRIMASFNDPVEGLEFLKENRPSLLFLDIEMPMLNGFDILQTLGEVDFDVIFTTAYSEFGIKAIKFSALDYLLKPIQVNELQEAVEKYKNKHRHTIPRNQVEGLLDNVEREAKGAANRIALATKEKIEFVPPDEIIVCISESNYTYVHLIDGSRRLISKTLKDFEDLLLPYQFIRSHNSYLINLLYVREYVRKDGGYLVMKNKMHIPIANNRKERVLRKLR